MICLILHNSFLWQLSLPHNLQLYWYPSPTGPRCVYMCPPVQSLHIKNYNKLWYLSNVPVL